MCYTVPGFIKKGAVIMATDKEYKDYILDQLTGVAEVSVRPMMGEYILYVRGKAVGGLYDDRLLVKPTPAAVALLPDAPRELPYPGGKAMLLVERTDDPAFLTELMGTLWESLPAPKNK